MERAVCTINPANGSLVPSPAQPQPQNPGILFSFQWIDQVFLPSTGPLNGGTGGGNTSYNSSNDSRNSNNNHNSSRSGGRYDRDHSSSSSSSNSRGPPPSQSRQNAPLINNGDYYTGEKPGFIVGCLTPMMNECFSRSLFGLPLNRKVS